MPHKLLFLCTGNYYRSRFAEMLFNALAPEAGLNWEADSRGLAAEYAAYIGPISAYAIRGLAMRGIEVGEAVRSPIQVQTKDLDEADLVIALKEAEHRSYLEVHFPDWAGKVEYWHVHDLNQAPAAEALAEIERQVRALIQRLSGRTGM